MLNKIVGEMRYAIFLLRFGGLWVFLKQLRLQLYSRSVQVGYVAELQKMDIPRIEAKIKYNLALATREDMDEVFSRASDEGKESVQKLIFRRWMYEDGYHHCYIARTADTNELCFLAFTVYPEDCKKVKGKFKGWFPSLEEDEVLLEGAYTFKKFRGNRLHPAITAEQLRICKEMGYRRARVHVKKNNLTSLKGSERAGYTRCEEVPELKILFITRRRFNEIG